MKIIDKYRPPADNDLDRELDEAQAAILGGCEICGTHDKHSEWCFYRYLDKISKLLAVSNLDSEEQFAIISTIYYDDTYKVYVPNDFFEHVHDSITRFHIVKPRYDTYFDDNKHVMVKDTTYDTRMENYKIFAEIVLVDTVEEFLQIEL